MRGIGGGGRRVVGCILEDVYVTRWGSVERRSGVGLADVYVTRWGSVEEIGWWV